jgi:hypothetical protein
MLMNLLTKVGMVVNMQMNVWASFDESLVSSEFRKGVYLVVW